MRAGGITLHRFLDLYSDLRMCRSFQFSDRSITLAPDTPLTVLSSDSQGWIHATVRMGGGPAGFRK